MSPTVKKYFKWKRKNYKLAGIENTREHREKKADHRRGTARFYRERRAIYGRRYFRLLAE